MPNEAAIAFASITEGDLANAELPHALVEVEHLRFAAVNHTFAELVKRDRLTLLGAYLDRFAPTNAKRTRALDAMVAGWVPNYQEEVSLPLDDGTAIAATMTATGVRDGNNAVAFLLVSFEAHGTTATFESGARPELVVDRRFTIRIPRDDFATSLGYTSDSIIGLTLISLIHPDDLQAFTNVAAHVREGRVLEATLRLRIVGGDFEFHTWETVLTPGRHRSTDLWFGAPIVAGSPVANSTATAAVVGESNAFDWNLLSPREHEVLVLVAQGLRVPSIARELFVHPGTVRNHLSAIFKKVGVASQHELADRLHQDPRFAAP